MSTHSRIEEEEVVESTLTTKHKGQLYKAEAELTRLQAKREKIGLECDQINKATTDSSDFLNGVLTLGGEIDQEYAYSFTSALRSFSRRNKQGEPLLIVLNSPGGEIISGLHIIDEIERLKHEGHHVTIRVRGQAASMAAVVLQSATTRQVGPNSFLMFHRAAFGSIGKTFEVEDSLETTKMFERQLVKIMADKSGQTVEWFKELFDKRKDVWWDSEEAVFFGLADDIH